MCIFARITPIKSYRPFTRLPAHPSNILDGHRQEEPSLIPNDSHPMIRAVVQASGSSRIKSRCLHKIRFYLLLLFLCSSTCMTTWKARKLRQHSRKSPWPEQKIDTARVVLKYFNVIVLLLLVSPIYLEEFK